MSTSKLDKSGIFSLPTLHAHGAALRLPLGQIHLRRNGIEFVTDQAIAPWTEMTIALRSPQDAEPFRGRGIVVDCQGNRHSGFRISMLLVGLSPQAQQQLATLVAVQSVPSR